VTEKSVSSIQMLSRPSAIVLIVANLVPLFGVLFLGWRVFDVIILYWAENVVIGVINVLRMIACRPGLGLAQLTQEGSEPDLSDTQRRMVARAAGAARFIVIPFFIVHYGMFCFGHFTAVTSLFDGELPVSWRSPLWLGVAAIFVSHLVSYWTNFIGSGEYKRTDLRQLMKRPYGRIIALHIAVIAGGFVVTLLGNPLPALLVLIAVKITIDLKMHERERRTFAVA
jgi:hypothetical protein